MNLRHTLRVALLLFLGIMGLALTVELLTGGLGSCTPCLTEDAQGPCYWDADTRSNGVGRSFTVDSEGNLTYWEEEEN